MSINKVNGKRLSRVSVLLYVVFMFVSAGVVAFIYGFIAVGSTFDVKNCPEFFTYMSFVLSGIALLPSMSSGIKVKIRENELITIVNCILVALLYAIIRIIIFPNFLRFEDIATSAFVLLSLLLVLIEKTPN